MKKKILVVDDSEEFRRLTKTILLSKYYVESAENGIKALSLLQDGNFMPDLIISDLNMPVLGGKDFLEQIKSSGAFKNIPVIILSSIDKSDEKIKLINLGASDYLEKPYNPAELLARIENIFKILK